MRSSEAAAIADVLFQTVETRKLTDDVRHRLAGRLKNIETPSVRVYPLSLEQDPIHPSSYYLAVDGLNHGVTSPLLLRLGLASSPASGLFPKSVLIGRMRPAGGREIVVNAIPFGPLDEAPLRTFTEQVAKSFLPRPQGGQAALMVPASIAVDGFESFRQIVRDTGQNRASFVASFREAESLYWPVVWAAVRAGWRDGYSLGVTGISSAEGLERLAGYSRYSVTPEVAAEVYELLRRLKPRGFDFELDLRGSTWTSAAIAEALVNFRSADRPVQSVIPPVGSDHEVLADILRQHNALLTVEGQSKVRGHQLLNAVP